MIYCSYCASVEAALSSTVTLDVGRGVLDRNHNTKHHSFMPGPIHPSFGEIKTIVDG